MSFNGVPTVKENTQPEDKVSRAADVLVKEAGEAIVEATEGMEGTSLPEDEPYANANVTEVKDGRTVSVDSEDWGPSWGGRSDTVKVSRRPSLFQRIFRREPKDVTSHSIQTDEKGRVHHRTVRPSVLGGRVEKTATISTGKDGGKFVGYEVTRYDAEGREVVRGSRDKFLTGHYAHQTTHGQVASERKTDRDIEAMDVTPGYKDERRQEERSRRAKKAAADKVVLDTSSAIAERVRGALVGTKDDIEPTKGFVPSKSVDTPFGTRSHAKAGEVPQVPKKATKYAEGYQAKRRAEQKALEDDPDNIENALKRLDDFDV